MVSDTFHLKELSPEQKAWRWRILISTYFAYAGYYLTRKVFTICKTSIAAEFNWELADTAHIWSAFLIAYMVGQFVNSYIGRKHGPRVLLLGGLGISIVCSVAFGFTNSFATFMVFMVINGLAQSSGWPGVVGAVAAWLRPAERGRIIGIWGTSFAFGNMLVKLIGGMLLHSYGWRWSFWGLTILSLAVWALIYFWQRNKPEDAGLEPILDPNADRDDAVQASQADGLSLGEYARVALNPIVLMMGTSYFCIKFLRYALDSWLPAFLNLKGLDLFDSSTYSMIFDLCGLGGVVLSGWALDRVFRGNWAMLCFVMSLGMIASYGLVLYFGTDPRTLAVCFGAVGFMMYGPDVILSGTAAVQVAGEKNGIAVAGLVNGLGSIGPVVQEEVIGWLIRGDVEAGMRNTNRLAMAMSILFTALMAVLVWQVHVARKRRAQSATA